MANETMTLIGTYTVGSGGTTSTISFASIPSTYTDLCLLYSFRTGFSANTQNIYVVVNTSAGSITARQLWGNGQTAYSTSYGTSDVGQAVGNNATSSTFSNGSFYFSNYAGSSNKAFSGDVLTENNATGVSVSHNITSGLVSNTAAITELGLWAGGQTLQQYSSMSLYGITKGSGGATVS